MGLAKDICEACKDGNCQDLHPFYLAGGLISILGALFVMFTYATNARLREHPSVLVFSRSFFDFLFAVYFVISFIIGDKLAVKIEFT